MSKVIKREDQSLKEYSAPTSAKSNGGYGLQFGLAVGPSGSRRVFTVRAYVPDPCLGQR